MSEEKHIVLNCVQDASQFYKIETISINPNNPNPYIKETVESSTTQGQVLSIDKGLFGTLGKYATPKDFHPMWQDIRPYGQHDYEIVVVLNARKNEVKVYIQNIGERTIEMNELNVLTPYTVAPMVGHRLLLKHRHKAEKGIDPYAIVHNITMAKMKWGMDQHII